MKRIWASLDICDENFLSIKKKNHAARITGICPLVTVRLTVLVFGVEGYVCSNRKQASWTVMLSLIKKNVVNRTCLLRCEAKTMIYLGLVLFLTTLISTS